MRLTFNTGLRKRPGRKVGAHCRNGHPRTPENTAKWKLGPHAKTQPCLVCLRIRDKKLVPRKRVKRLEERRDAFWDDL